MYDSPCMESMVLVMRDVDEEEVSDSEREHGF